MWAEDKSMRVSRTVQCRTLDGTRISVDLQVTFKRSLAQAAAEAIGHAAAEALRTIVGDQIVQGSFPMTPSELEDSVRSALKREKHVAEVHVLSLRRAAPTSGVPYRNEVPAAAEPQNRRAISAIGLQAARSNPPAASSSLHPTASSRPAPSPELIPPPARATSSAPPRARSAPTPSAVPRSSGQAIPELEVTGAALARVLRQAAGNAMVLVLAALTEEAIDRFSLLEGKAPAPELRREVCACVAASMYRAASESGVSPRTAATVVDAACRQADTVDGPFTAEIGRYLTHAAPTTELAARLVAVLGLERQAPRLVEALAANDKALRARVGEVLRGSSFA